MFRKTIACLLIAAFLANVGCSTLPPTVRVLIEGPARDLALKQLAAIWKNDIPIQHTDHTFYPTVERLPGAAFRPTTLPLADLAYTVLIDPGDYDIPAHFYCTGVYLHTGSGYRYRLAKLEGKFSQALTQLYVRASKANTPTDEVQVLSWSLQAGIAYDDLNAPQRALVDRLIPEYRAQMQLGLMEKIMHDWNAWSSTFPLVSPEVVLAQMGKVGTYINTLMRARQDILNRNYRYDALWSLFAPQRDAPAPADQDKTPWSRIHPRIYMRFIAPRGAKSDGVIQLRILDGHSYHQQPSNATLVAQSRPNREADACALPDSLDCKRPAIDAFESLAGPRLAQAAYAGSPGFNDLTNASLGSLLFPMSMKLPTIPVGMNWDLVQGPATVEEVWRLMATGVVVGEAAAAAAVPALGPIIAIVLITLILYKIATSEQTQSLTASFLKVIEGGGEKGRRVSCRFVGMIDFPVPIEGLKVCLYMCTDGLPYEMGTTTGDCQDITGAVR